MFERQETRVLPLLNPQTLPNHLVEGVWDVIPHSMRKWMEGSLVAHSSRESPLIGKRF